MSRVDHNTKTARSVEPTLIKSISIYSKQEQYLYLINNDVLKKTARSIEAERFYACGAFLLYPLLGIMFRSRWLALYSFVCSSWHIMHAYNLEKQMNDYMLANYRSPMVQYVGKKYRCYPYGIGFEDKNLWNFYHSTFKDDFKRSADFPYVDLDESNLRYVNQILAYRRNRFKAMLSAVVLSKIVSCWSGSSGFAFMCAFLFSANLFSQSQQLNDIKFSISNDNYRYLFVDFAGNVNFTNNLHGFRKRYLTKNSLDFAKNQPLQISPGEQQQNDDGLRPRP